MHLRVRAGRGVVRGSAQQMDVGWRKPPERGKRVRRIVPRRHGQWPLDAFGTAGCSGRVVHRDDGGTEELVGGRRVGPRPQLGISDVPGTVEPGELGQRRRDDVVVVVDEGCRSRVGNDVRDFRRHCAIAERHDERTKARRAVPDTEQLRNVVQHHGDAVAVADADLLQRSRHLVGPRVELLIRDASVASDERDP